MSAVDDWSSRTCCLTCGLQGNPVIPTPTLYAQLHIPIHWQSLPESVEHFRHQLFSKVLTPGGNMWRPSKVASRFLGPGLQVGEQIVGRRFELGGRRVTETATVGRAFKDTDRHKRRKNCTCTFLAARCLLMHPPAHCIANPFSNYLQQENGHMQK